MLQIVQLLNQIVLDVDLSKFSLQECHVWLHVVAWILAWCAAFVYPILYVVFSEFYKREFKALFGCGTTQEYSPNANSPNPNEIPMTHHDDDDDFYH